jgi:hypothetical protein
MNSLFDTQTAEEILQRIDNLKVDSPRTWGKMDVAQMMAHCVAGLETAVGDRNPPQSLFGKVVGRFMKGMLTDDKPMSKNLPTSPQFTIVDVRDFEREKSRLITLTKRLSEGGEDGITKNPHPFFGKITPIQWSSGQWKHLDHHLRQFGV